MKAETTPNEPWFQEVVLPALLRHARTTYGIAMRRALVGAGYDDVPKNGLYVLGGLTPEAGPLPLQELIEQLRISKQSASQLVDTLVARGYLQRAEDPNDRRKLTITLTERGRHAAETQSAARKKVDAELLQRMGQESIDHTRRTLAALIEIGRGDEAKPGED